MFIQLLPSNTRGGVALLVDDDCLLEESGADEQVWWNRQQGVFQTHLFARALLITGQRSART